MSDYLDFLRKKIKLATFKGFKVEPSADCGVGARA